MEKWTFYWSVEFYSCCYFYLRCDPLLEAGDSKQLPKKSNAHLFAFSVVMQ